MKLFNNINRKQYVMAALLAVFIVVGGLIYAVRDEPSGIVDTKDTQSNDLQNAQPENTNTVYTKNLANQAKANASDMKRYSGSDFEVQYPSSWYVDSQTNDDIHLNHTYFSSKPLDMGEMSPSSSSIAVYVFTKGHKICDCNPTEYVDENTDLVRFARSNNGLLPEQEFKKVQKQTRIIGGFEAIKYVGDVFNTPWIFKRGDSIYSIQHHKNTDVDKAKQEAWFESFLQSFSFK